MRALPILIVLAGCNGAPSVARLADGQTAQLIYTLDANQMALAQTVRDQLQRPDVLQVADMLGRDHATVDDQANSVVCREQLWARPSALSRAFEDDALSLYFRLGVVETPDDTYLTAERAAQRDALAVFDCAIAPAIEDAALREFVMGPLHDHLASHVRAVDEVMRAPAEAPACSALCDDGTLSERIRHATCDAS
jgi:predicted outer membrane protein